MTNISNISAVIFDMDGTLVDSEVLTEPAIKAFCHENGIDSEFCMVGSTTVLARVTCKAVLLIVTVFSAR